MTVRSFEETPVNSNPVKTKKLTVLDQLKTELSKPSNAIKEVTLRVPVRDGISVKYNTDLSLQQIDRWRLSSRKNKKTDEIDVLAFNLLVIDSQCAGLVFHDEEALDDDGTALTFRSPEVLEMLNCLESKGAIKTLYERDADILKAGTEILTAAGFGDSEDEDPLI